MHVSRMRAKNEIKNPQDNIELDEEECKDRYYEKKFCWNPIDTAEKYQLMQSWLEELQWVMKYYYFVCMSLGWYYPHPYPPFASDLVQSSIIFSESGTWKTFPTFHAIAGRHADIERGSCASQMLLRFDD